MDDHTIKHLEFIQGVIDRMARNSFAYKGWAVILIAGLFALGTKDADKTYFMVALLPAIAFWGLDAFYLRQERLFIALYNDVRESTPDDPKVSPFSMNIKPYRTDSRIPSWWCTCWSRTVVWVYAPLTAVIIITVLIAGKYL